MTNIPANDEAAISSPVAEGAGRWWKRFTPKHSDSDPRTLGKWIGVLTAIYVLLSTGFGIYWSQTPDRFDVRQNAVQYAALTEQDVVTGAVTVSALQEMIRTLLEKPGGYLHNDVFPPGSGWTTCPTGNTACWYKAAISRVR